MSGPYRFTHEPARSPLDRRAQAPSPANQPVSYKTNVNRAKTKKWVEAKKNAYDGDDWGDYDEYDEYGADQPPVPAMPPPAPKGYGQRLDQPARSFTEPRQQPAPSHSARRNSFEAGEEQRAFSASVTQSPLDDYGHQPFGAPPQPQPQTQTHPAYRQPSGAESDISDTPQHRKDFVAAALPPPLTTRASTGPPMAPTSSPPNTQFPPRKSSIGQSDLPSPTSPRARAPSNPNKPLPFVRPSDIYKRYEEDKQRTSMDSSRPSIDSLNAASAPPSKEGKITDAGNTLQPLQTVSERKSGYLPGPNTAGNDQSSSSQSWLPPVESMVSFDSDFWPGGQQTQLSDPSSNTPADQGFRSVVDQAFTRNDEQRSVPPTPISKSESGVSRSNTDSTAGISPIMSRVPSGAASALRNRNQNGEGSTPVIVEEAGERPPTANAMGGITPPKHSRNISNTSLPLATPNSVESPARSPAIEPQKNVPEPVSAQLSTLASPVSDASTREADIAMAVSQNPNIPAPELGALEKDSQRAYLDSHNLQSTSSEALPRSRSESPSKGRVQELAGKFGDVSQSRRNSTQSNASRNSQESWEKSQDNSRPSSVVQDPATRPNAEREASFRPKLPGQWESYATSAATPYDADKQLGSAKDAETGNQNSSSLQEVDFAPTTSKHPVASAEPSDPLAALKVAGAAAAEALQASFGGQNSQNPTREIPPGDVLPRPLLVERTPSAMSSIPPTPPAKDTPASETPPPLPPLKGKEAGSDSRRTSGAHGNLERPGILPQLSVDPSTEDRESDRLRKEIVASLTPKRTSVDPTEQTSLQSMSPPPGRESSVYPSEYDSYFAGGSPQPTNDLGLSQTRSGQSVSEPPKANPEPPTGVPSLLTRFSWENKGSPVPTDAQDSSATAHQASRGVEEHVQISSPPIEPDTKEHSSPDASRSNPPTTTDDETKLSTDRVGSPAPVGLHVVNSASDPEAVDLPPRLSADVSPAAPPKEATSTSAQETKTSDAPKASLLTTQIAASGMSAQSPTIKSPISDKPLGFRDIVNMKSSTERITTYNQTREYWAHTDHGLSAWISSALDSNPELASQTISPSRPTRTATSSIRHKPTGSISLFGKHISSSQQTEQSGASSSHAPTASTSSSFYGGSGGRNASLQMQTKGKDLLHTAGVLSGKGMTGAKGLFAKGKSRFKSDKVHSQSETWSSREASEEPELVSTTPDLERMSVDGSTANSPIISREEKKSRRRFSSPFHRSSRSRSRPSSIILPGSLLFDFTSSNTPRNTPPPRELPPPIIAESLVQSSYQAPDDWNTVPDDTTTTTIISAPTPLDARRLTAPERLGVLPSPAKSPYTFLPYDREDEGVPPVPPLPRDTQEAHVVHEDGVAGVHGLSQRLIESIVRYSTPAPTLTAESVDAKRNEEEDDGLPPQLNHEPIPAQTFTGSATVDGSGSTSRVPHDSLAVGQVSPVLSCVGADRLDGGEGDGGRDQGSGQLLVQERQLSMGDVSPMFPPVELAQGYPSDDGGWPMTSAPVPVRRAYETELIGGDVSPISRQASSDDVEERLCALPTTMTPPVTPGAVEPEPSPSTSPPPPPSQARGRAMEDALTPRAAELRPRYTERLSATRIQVVHAEQYVPSRSQSSFETIDQDSFVTHSQSDGSPLDDDNKSMDDDEVPLVPQLPPLKNPGLQDSPSPVAPERPKQQTGPPVMISITDASPLATSPGPDSFKPRPDQSPAAETSSSQPANKHPESMLSRLSSMVSSERVSVSPLSSQHLHSRSPSLHHRQPISPAKTSRNPAQIVRGSATKINGDAPSDDDFDLYADQDGVVKDVRDESGQPLRISPPEIPTKMQNPPPPRQPPTAKSVEDDQSRYSLDRPMSFVSGPRDSNGRPQDQINRPNTASSERLDPSLQRSPQNKSTNGGAYTASSLGQQVPQTNGQSDHNSSPYPQHGGNPQPNERMAPHAPMGSGSSFAVSPEQAPIQAQHSAITRLNPPNEHSPNVPGTGQIQDPRMVSEAQMRATGSGRSFPQDLRFQGQDVQRNAAIPGQYLDAHQMRDYQAHQSMMQQAVDPRLQQIRQQSYDDPYNQPTLQQPSRKEEKPTSRPKISSVFKNLGKTNAKTPSPPPRLPLLQPSQPDYRRLSAGENSSTENGQPSSIHQLQPGDLAQQQQPGLRKERKSGGFTLFPTRPESTGTASYISHESTSVQPADSRYNLTSPELPANFVGIPPQQPPPAPLDFSDPRFSTLNVPEPGKKKRFSALGNLFGRNKEDKKALKAKKHNTLPPMPPGQPWPSQQQSNSRTHHQSMQFGSSPPAHPFQGMQAAPPPTVSTIPPQGTSSHMLPHQPVQQIQPGFQQPLSQSHHQQEPQQYSSPPLHVQQQPSHSERSAYIDSQQRAQQHQAAVLTSQRPAENIGVTGHPLNHQHLSVNRSGGTAQAPPEGYYISETKLLPDHRQGTPQTSAQQNFPPSQQQRAPATQPPHLSNHQTAHGPNDITSISQQHRKSSTANEPRYETPAIPAAYAPVSGAYVSPNVEGPPPPPNMQSRDRQPSPTYFQRQYSEPQMQPLSPQVSALTQAPTPTDHRHNSESSSVSLISPISTSPPSMTNSVPVPNQKPQNPRMSSITEQSHAERPWNLNLPQGATEQEIVRARQRQYMEQQLLFQEQLYAERTGRSPSPRSNTTQSSSPRPSQQGFAHPLSQNGGFRELMPRSSPQPYPRAHSLHPRASSDMLDPEKEMLARAAAQKSPTPNRVPTPTSHPLPMSPDPTNIHSPINPIASSLPPPAPPDVAHHPVPENFGSQQAQLSQSQQRIHQHSPRYEEHIAPDEQYQSPVHHPTQHGEPDYEHSPPADQPPPYSGPTIPNVGMEKERQDRHRPPNIVTNTDEYNNQLEFRQRQISIGMLQHPQPASMAASPSPSSADMGAESLRRQLLHQEESERQERLRRAQIQREESLREREERERARARARVLERSVSGGGRVPSLRSDAGSTRATGTGWERRRGSTSRPVFELSAEDDEPVMRATSFPGQEWVPTWTDD
ncbi:unnamed protein product [Periconia digitata]|uniref:Uncharacterized protein n=1 Tax=Periconia digitata TaxID=1303443 RepID=A0A9W4UGP6_9PLEO|nr:unnamed protein product [Periconia digitata]